MEVEIKGPELGRGADCERILRELPDWFAIEQAIVDLRNEVEKLPTFLAEAGGQCVGILSFRQHFERSSEVAVIGVLPSFHRRGVGKAMLARAEEWLRENGVTWLQVKTLSPSRASEEYERTRAFYLSVGFEPLQEFPNLWDEENPCLQMVKAL